MNALRYDILLINQSVQTTTVFQAPEGEHEGETDVPFHVINNYFSVGVDAQIALEYHDERGCLMFAVVLSLCYTLVAPLIEANPEKLNNQFKSKFFNFKVRYSMKH